MSSARMIQAMMLTQGMIIRMTHQTGRPMISRSTIQL